jgi:exodeoxyribonuclease VII large subunit
LVYKEEKLLNTSEVLSKGDKVRITFGSGGAEAEITDKW